MNPYSATQAVNRARNGEHAQQVLLTLLTELDAIVRTSGTGPLRDDLKDAVDKAIRAYGQPLPTRATIRDAAMADAHAVAARHHNRSGLAPLSEGEVA